MGKPIPRNTRSPQSALAEPSEEAPGPMAFHEPGRSPLRPLSSAYQLVMGEVVPVLRRSPDDCPKAEIDVRPSQKPASHLHSAEPEMSSQAHTGPVLTPVAQEFQSHLASAAG